MFAKMTLKLTAQTWQLPGTNTVHKEPQNHRLTTRVISNNSPLYQQFHILLFLYCSRVCFRIGSILIIYVFR